MYKLYKNPRTGEMENGVLRMLDSAFIPFAEGNTDYAEYLKWIEAGNTPQPPDESE